ncbi:hypothetical protein F2Q70_00025597 [Brassica cretica]|uniref:Ubiquitin-like protease family profile domain-containing protein n=1 Tax=Brassica cretica TaxID=69181 RepID=A0A8S9LJL0_BRACR|nr:hypothetical protein F2Q70_00025597 [Brassica cretica]
MHGLMSYRRFRRARSLRSDRALARARARSLRSDRAERTLGCYVATKLWLELGCHAATERNTRSVAAWRPFSSSCPMTRVSSAKLFTSNLTILDSFITENPTEAHVDVQMTPILKSLPYILEQYVGYTVYQISEGVRFYSWNRVESIYPNKMGGDCAPCAVKFMEMHSNGDGKEEMSLITYRVVDKIREQYAMDCYEEFVGDYRVANEASMK